jgi:FAD/FMN-containing dehydrogenase
MITKPSYLKKIFKPGIYRRGFLKRLTALTLGSAVIPLFPAAVRAGVKGIGDDVEALQNVIKGNVITRDNKSYELWRQTMVWWLHKPSRYPDMIVLAKNDVDVVEAIKFARKNQIKVKVRTGGHSYTSSSIFDNGMLIDVSALHSVEIDAEAKLAVIGPGITSEVLLEELNQYGLAFPVAHEATVPMGGYLLGGGIGWNGEGLGGPACFSIRAVELVTPDGELIPYTTL